MAHNQAIELVEAELRNTGYAKDLIYRNYQYAAFSDSGSRSRTAELAAFAQAPPSDLTASIGVTTSKDFIQEMRSLGAVILLEIEGERGRPWVNTADGPRLLLDEAFVPLRTLFQNYREEWQPARIFRAKSMGAVDRSAQRSFVDLGLLPALESEARAKLDKLIREVTQAAVRTYSEAHQGETPDEKELFRLLFALITAKVLADRRVITDLDFSNPREMLRQIRPYNPLTDTSFDDVVLREATDRIASSFPFSNLRVDTLAYVYENTGVTPETRKRLSVHYTPSYVAEYILSRLPIADINPSELAICDPMCGHGTFLVASLSRLQDILPNEWSPKDRHRFFIEHIRGRDVEPFSVEVARLTLTLADLPNPDGWDIQQADAYVGNTLQDSAETTNVFLTNPPFEELTKEERNCLGATQATKASEMLVRALPSLPENALIGIVLPVKFLEGGQFKRSREIVAQQFEVLELTLLPDRVFGRSESETVLLMARKSPSLAKSKSYYINYRSVTSRGLDEFKLKGQFSRDESLPAEVVLGHKNVVAPTFWVPALYSVWDALYANRRVVDIANIERGVQFVSGLLSDHYDEIVRDHEFLHSMCGVNRVDDQLLPFHLRNIRWLSTDPAKRRQMTAKAWELPWHEPKVLLNAARRSRGPWRLIAAYDKSGLLATQHFHAAWPKEDVSAPFLTAFLNSAIANAYVSDHELTRNNRITTLEFIPLPPLNASVVVTVQDIALECERKIAADPHSDLTVLMLNLDAELLKAYDLAPHEEKRLLEIFAGADRPGCSSFPDFFPGGFEVVGPLSEHLSDESLAIHTEFTIPLADYERFLKALDFDAKPTSEAMKAATEYSKGRIEGDKYRW